MHPFTVSLSIHVSINDCMLHFMQHRKPGYPRTNLGQKGIKRWNLPLSSYFWGPTDFSLYCYVPLSYKPNTKKFSFDWSQLMFNIVWDHKHVRNLQQETYCISFPFLIFLLISGSDFFLCLDNADHINVCHCSSVIRYVTVSSICLTNDK